MFFKLRLAIALTILIVGSVKNISAQITISQEPHHKLLFQNKNVRVYLLKLTLGDTTLEHSHRAQSVVIFLTPSKLAIKNAGEQPVITKIAAGTTVFRNYGEKPVVHTVWCEDSALFECLVVELLDSSVTSNHCTLNAPSTLLWQQKLVDAYSLQIPAKGGYHSSKIDCPQLLVCISGAADINTSTKNLKSGDFAFFEPNENINVSLGKRGPANFVLLAIK